MPDSSVMNLRRNKWCEDRLRRMADRRGYILHKSRARDPRNLTYGGYHLTHRETGSVACGWGNADRNFAATLEEIEHYLTKD
jgi:hypothetical protein